jgi:serine/threonine protein kinase
MNGVGMRRGTGEAAMEMREPAESIEAAPEGYEPRTFGRYVLYAPIARGGMATIHIARLVGDDGFSRIVAAKRLHSQFTEDPDFVEMFRDEAEIASKIHHPNVVPVLDIVLDGEEVILVQEYVHGVPLDRLFRAACVGRKPIPPRIVVGIMAGILSGLHAAHETTDERGEPLEIIHRDVSPQNVMISVDGIPRLLDFGIAKASSCAHVTRAGMLKGKIAYMAPEQMRTENVTRAADVYACGVVLWELLALRRLHAGRSDAQVLAAVLKSEAPTLLEALGPQRPEIPKERWDLLSRLEPVVTKAMAVDPLDRYPTAAEMLTALLRVAPAASALEVAEWVKYRGGEYLERRQQVLASNEESWRSMSKIAVAPSVDGPPSGVSRVRGESRVIAAARLAADLQSAAVEASIAALREESTAALREARRLRIVPWIVAGLSVVLSVVLVTVLEMRTPAPVAVVVASPPEPVVAAPPPETPAPAEANSLTTSFLAALPPPLKVTRIASPALRKSPVDPAAPVHAAATASPPSGVVTGALPPKVDCDPPFYFDGTKKIFKPACI